MRFPEKLTILMRRQALSNLALGKALGGIAHTTVAGWLRGSTPRGAAARKLAEYFGVPVDLLLDDTKNLPASVMGSISAANDIAGVPWKDRELVILPTPQNIQAFIREHPEKASGLMYRLLQAQKATEGLLVQIRGYQRSRAKKGEK